MEVAGRNVVKISMFLTFGSNSLDCTESERMLILYPAFGIDVGFNDQGILIDGIKRSPKG